MVDTAVDKTIYTQEEQTDQVAYTSRSHPYPPCVAPPAEVLLEELRKRSPAVVPTKALQLLGDGSKWKRQERVGDRRSKSEYLHVATGYNTTELDQARAYEAKIVKLMAAGIVCRKDETTGKPLFTHDDGWSSRDSQNPVLSATNQLAKLHKDRP